MQNCRVLGADGRGGSLMGEWSSGCKSCIITVSYDVADETQSSVGVSETFLCEEGPSLSNSWSCVS